MMIRPTALFALSLALFAGSGAAFAQPEPKAPATPPADAPAMNIDPAAKALLDESVAALKNLKSLRYSVSRRTDGMGEQMRLGLNGAVRWIRPSGPAPMYHFKGTTDLVMEGETPQTLSVFGSTRIVYVDEAAKTVFDEPNTNQAAGYKWVSRLRELAIPAFLSESNPLEREQRARQMSFGEPREIHGELCTVVNFIIEANKSESVVAFSNVDKLPRLIERRRIEGKMRIGPTWEVWDVSTVPVEPKDLEIATPAGFTLKKTDIPAPGAPVQPKGVGAAPSGGLPLGAAVPAFNVNTITGAAFTQDNLKGKVTVLGFWQPQVAASLDLAKSLQSFADSVKGQAVQVIGVGCREGSDAEGVKSFMGASGFNFTSLVSADALADSMNIRGFPSVAVINADGKLAAFFESVPAADRLAASVAAAAAPAGK